MTWKYRGEGGEGEEGQRVVKAPKESNGDVIMSENIGGGESDAVKEICVGGCIRSNNLCEECSMVRVSL